MNVSKGPSQPEMAAEFRLVTSFHRSGITTILIPGFDCASWEGLCWDWRDLHPKLPAPFLMVFPRDGRKACWVFPETRGSPLVGAWILLSHQKARRKRDQTRPRIHTRGRVSPFRETPGLEKGNRLWSLQFHFSAQVVSSLLTKGWA